jgi:hypothetical protein
MFILYTLGKETLNPRLGPHTPSTDWQAGEANILLRIALQQKKKHPFFRTLSFKDNW